MRRRRVLGLAVLIRRGRRLAIPRSPGFSSAAEVREGALRAGPKARALAYEIPTPGSNRQSDKPPCCAASSGRLTLRRVAPGSLPFRSEECRAVGVEPLTFEALRRMIAVLADTPEPRTIH
jgi:hypothetical protein